MKKIIIFITILFSFHLFSQNQGETEADYEIQGFFKNFQNFSIESLKKEQFKYAIEHHSGFGKLLFERKRDNGITEKRYKILINFVEKKSYKYKEYKVITLSKNDSIFGLINVDLYRKKTNYYFNYKELNKYIEYHNQYYESKLTSKDFIDQVLANHIYGYSCNDAPISYNVPRYNELKFDDKNNILEFKNWTKSFNIELQTFGVKALRYLTKNKGLKLNQLDNKIISNIEKRNSTLNTCSGCIYGIYKKVFE